MFRLWLIRLKFVICLWRYREQSLCIFLEAFLCSINGIKALRTVIVISHFSPRALFTLLINDFVCNCFFSARIFVTEKGHQKSTHTHRVAQAKWFLIGIKLYSRNNYVCLGVYPLLVFDTVIFLIAFLLRSLKTISPVCSNYA